MRYQLSAAPLLVYACHRHDCQTRSGAAFTLSIVARSADVSVSGPIEAARRSRRLGRTVEQSYCPQCRVPIFARAIAASEFMTLLAGALDDASWVTPITQTLVESAIPWAVIPGVRAVPWDRFDYVGLGREWAASAPAFAPP